MWWFHFRLLWIWTPRYFAESTTSRVWPCIEYGCVITCSYEAEFIQSLLSTGRKQLASRFNFTYRYIDDVLSINNPEFENYLCQMYPVELEIKDTTESNTSASYLDLLLSIGRDGQLHTSIYDKCDDFNFHITNFPFLNSNIPTSPAYGVFISQLIRYARACSSYGCFILRATRLSNKLLEQGYVKERLKSSLRKFNGRYGDLINQYEVSLTQMLNDILWPDHIQWQPPTDQTIYRTRPYTEFWVVSIEHLRRVWHADRGRLLLRTPGPVPLGLAYVLLVEINPFPNLSLFYRTMLFEYPSVLSRFSSYSWYSGLGISWGGIPWANLPPTSAKESDRRALRHCVWKVIEEEQEW